MKNLITEYKATKSDECFLLIYEMVKRDREAKMSYFKSKGLSDHEITEGLDEALLESIHNWDSKKSGFQSFFRNCADLRIIDARRRTLAKDRWEVYEPDEDMSNEGEDEYINFVEQDIRLEDFPTVEKEVISIRERNKEQRQLFQIILNEVDEKLRQQLLVIAGGQTKTYAARKYNMHHQTLN